MLIALGLLITLGLPAQSQPPADIAPPPAERVLPASAWPEPRPHPLPPSLAQWQDRANRGDYFDQVQLSRVEYLVWSRFPVTVYLEPISPETTPSFSTRQAQTWTRVVRQAMQEWNTYLPLQEVSQPSQADITFLRSDLPLRLNRPNTTSQPASPDGSPVPLNQRIRAAETRYDLYLRRSPGQPPILTHRFTIRLRPNQAEPYLLATARHELGHALGIWGHSPDVKDALYFSQVGKPAKISVRDINTLRRIYQQPTRSGWPLQRQLGTP